MDNETLKNLEERIAQLEKRVGELEECHTNNTVLTAWLFSREARFTGGLQESVAYIDRITANTDPDTPEHTHLLQIRRGLDGYAAELTNKILRASE
ncbi:hypothetical protein [Neisseria perflava]|uniref:hypothetical protein n=1 Tax=Neisseria perflava TaxID=33053 RepID=UPI00209E3ABA|nr:hypothetical protein [Neisseria perflava]MCP1659301.1 hypothetical protein [Neisseria perflava]